MKLMQQQRTNLNVPSLVRLRDRRLRPAIMAPVHAIGKSLELHARSGRRRACAITAMLSLAAASWVQAVDVREVSAPAAEIAHSSGLIAQSADGRLVVATGANIGQQLGTVGKLAPIVALHPPYSAEDATYSSAAFCLLAFSAPNMVDAKFGSQGAVLTP